jgi:hypothetical protein
MVEVGLPHSKQNCQAWDWVEAGPRDAQAGNQIEQYEVCKTQGRWMERRDGKCFGWRCRGATYGVGIRTLSVGTVILLNTNPQIWLMLICSRWWHTGQPMCWNDWYPVPVPVRTMGPMTCILIQVSTRQTSTAATTHPPREDPACSVWIAAGIAGYRTVGDSGTMPLGSKR